MNVHFGLHKSSTMSRASGKQHTCVTCIG